MKTYQFDNLPYVSLNDLYSGSFWGRRHELKRRCHIQIALQAKEKYPEFKVVYSRKIRGLCIENKLDGKYCVDYEFIRSVDRPYDAMNCSYMAKMIEDALFKNDNWMHIKEVRLKSSKVGSSADYVNRVIVKITEL